MVPQQANDDETTGMRAVDIADAHQRYEKISNKSSFGIIDIADHSSTSDRITVIVDTACFINSGAYR